MSCDERCGQSFDLTKGNDSNIQDKYVGEALKIGGAVVNVFKLLGIHEQGQMQDVTGLGKAISGGDGSKEWIAGNAFSRDACRGWRSKQYGADVTRSAFIGYDFGPIRNVQDDRNVYGVETYVHKHITSMNIQQGSDPNKRATSVRVERSLDGITWYGAAIVSLPDDDKLNTIFFKGSSPSRFWRLRPTAFRGGVTDSWEVVSLQLMDYEKTELSNIQDQMGFLEARDRDYSSGSIRIKASYDLLDVQTDVGPWGAGPSNQIVYFTTSFTTTVQALGRPIVIGDIFEIPSEVQYDHNMNPIKKYMEVTDVAWSTEGYTPGWKPTLQRIIAEPMLSSQETLDILGDIKRPDQMGFLDIDDSQYTDLTNIAHRVYATGDMNVPERGEDQYEIAAIEQEVIDDAAEKGFNVAKLSSNQRKLYVEDGMPPNGEKYTEGPKFPESPSDRDYHRVTYPDTDVPPRLFRYSLIKHRWVYCETDRRSQYNLPKPTLQNMIKSKDAVNINDTSTVASERTTVITPPDDCYVPNT